MFSEEESGGQAYYAGPIARMNNLYPATSGTRPATADETNQAYSYVQAVLCSLSRGQIEWCAADVSREKIRTHLCSSPTLFVNNDGTVQLAREVICSGTYTPPGTNPVPTTGGDNTMMYVLGGLAPAAVIGVVVITRKKKGA